MDVKRRNHWLLFAILLLALINLSPSKNSANISNEDVGNAEMIHPPSPEKVQEEGHLKILVKMDEVAFTLLQQMNQSYMNTHPIQVELVNSPPEASYSSTELQLELGESPDVLLLDNVWIRRFAAEGYLLPTENYYFGSLTGEVLSSSLAQNEWNSYVWGVPLDVDPYVLAYNPAALKQLGLEKLPKSALEWTGLITEFMNQQEIPYLLGLNYEDPFASMSLLWQLGGESLKANEISPISPFALTEETEVAIQQIELLQPHLLNLIEGSSELAEDGWKKFYNGEVAIILARASEAEVRQYPRMEISFTEPTNSGRTMWINGRSYVVSAQTDNAEAAGSWIAEMTNQAGQRDWYAMTGHLPVLKSLYYNSSKNGLPEWVPASLVNKQGGSLPVGAILPAQMDEFSRASREFLRGTINAEDYMTRISEINDETIIEEK